MKNTYPKMPGSSGGHLDTTAMLGHKKVCFSPPASSGLLLLSDWWSEPSQMNRIGSETKRCQEPGQKNTTSTMVGQQKNDLVSLRMRVKKLQSLLESLEMLTLKCSDDLDPDDDEEQRCEPVSPETDFEVTSGLICDEISHMFTMVTHIYNNQPQHNTSSAKLLQRLNHCREEAALDPARDISVAFFGLDWANTHSLVKSLEARVDQLCVGLRLHRTDACLFSMTVTSLSALTVPYHIYGDLCKLEADILTHTEAVLSGRTHKRHREHIRKEQRKMSLQGCPNLKGFGCRRRSSGDADCGSRRRLNLVGGLVSLVRQRCRRLLSAPTTANEMEQLKQLQKNQQIEEEDEEQQQQQQKQQNATALLR